MSTGLFVSNFDKKCFTVSISFNYCLAPVFLVYSHLNKTYKSIHRPNLLTTYIPYICMDENK